MSYRILLVDDEPDILEFISYNLNKEGYTVYTASNGREAVQKALEVIPHVILLDVMMPEMDGIETCQEIRTHPELAATMIAFLTARSEDYSQIAGFDAGADDYITKPIRVKVLVSRIKALLKRVEGTQSAPGRALQMDRERYLVVKEGQQIVLPRKEFNLLALLYSKPQKVFTREEIFSSVWGSDVVVGDRTIDVHIRKLREKIGDDHIVTVKGVGYKYED
ncbi:response regulator transcription factor [Gallalistipes aquisgranensis]|uniref:response regulator transcription factor n=1 Tax=Gallalistipes aquisgranensis TaxID=2779358 RepID=UPI001CF906ED|nr:response regulator transcription factor [Gallalistipes aquisgranensis]MBE5033359.1 response regulator transcription factor [Gallalistipes aquisgranensis]